MPRKIDGVQYYTKAEIDQMMTGGLGASLGSHNALPIIVAQADWTLQSGGDYDGWYYADLTHGRTTAGIVRAIAFIGADAYVHSLSEINDIQQVQSSSVLRIWLQDEPAYDLLFLLVYA